MKRIRLQARILLLATAGIVAVSLIDLASQAFVEIRDSTRSFTDQAHSIGNALIPSLSNDLVVGDLATAQQTLDRVQRHARFKRLALLDPVSSQVLLEGRLPEDDAEEDAAPAWFARLIGVRIEKVSLPITAGGVRYGALLVEPSGTLLERSLWDKLWIVSLLSLLALFIVLPLFILTLRGGLRPLRELAASAKKFGAGDYSQRAPVSSVREISQTARAFNHMAGNIQSLLDQLHTSNASNRRMALIVEQSGEIIMTLDNAGIVTSWNAGAASTLGYSAAEAIGQGIDFLLPDMLPDESERLSGQIRETRPVERHETRFRAQDGRVLDIALGLTPLLDDTGQRAGLICVGRDFTERKQAQDEIRRMNQALEQRVRERTAELEAANRELEAFSYSVSHDLRAPLRTLNGFSKILVDEEGPALSDHGRHLLQRIQAASLRMDRLIEDLLNLASLGRQELKRADVDLTDIAEVIRSDLVEAQPGRSVAWHIQPGLAARADPVLIRVVLDNLLRNAWKYTAERAEADITFTVQVAGAENVFCIRDNGAGFNPAQAYKLFKPFQRLHKSDRFEGTGIGLATVSRILQRHGGRIWAEGAEGQGAAFHFTLP